MNLVALRDYITNIGVDDSVVGREVVKVRLLNQLIFLAIVNSLLGLIIYIASFEDIKYIFSIVANVSLELIAFFLASRRKHSQARFIATFIFPTFIASHVMMLGGNFGEANIFTALAFGAFILHEGYKRIQIFSVTYICLLFTFSKLYAIQNFPNAVINQNPYDDLITFPMILIILATIILIYQKELRKYEREKSNLIRDLKVKNQKLEEINEELKDFTYIASHDLKTPLRTVSSHLDLIRLHLKRNDIEAVDIDIEYAKNGAKKMYALISDILEYKEINKTNKVVEVIDLNVLLKTVKSNLSPLIAEKRGVIYSEKLVKIKAERQDIRVLFQKIIENGLTYNTSKNPQIHINCELEEETFKIVFKDNGIGIPIEYQEKIFQFFKRLHTNETYDGTGLGLGLCRKIVRYYEGEIEVQSVKNDGAMFTVILPRKLLA